MIVTLIYLINMIYQFIAPLFLQFIFSSPIYHFNTHQSSKYYLNCQLCTKMIFNLQINLFILQILNNWQFKMSVDIPFHFELLMFKGYDLGFTLNAGVPYFFG